MIAQHQKSKARSWIVARALGSPEESGGLGSPEERFYPYARPWVAVGLDPSDPGSQWSQAPTAKEQAQGYKQTDLLTLQILVGQLRTAIESLLSQADPSTDASALGQLKALHDQVVSLDTAVASRVSQGYDSPSLNYPTLLVKYKAFKAQFDSFGVEEVTAPAPKPTAANPAPPPPEVKTIKPPTTPTAPTITTKPSNPWWWLVVAGVAAVGGIAMIVKMS